MLMIWTLSSICSTSFFIYATTCRLGRLQDSNAVLSHFNEYSEHCFAEVSSDFSRNTRLLKSMKSDLDYIFQKLRSMKVKIMATYPDAFPDELSREEFDQRPDLEVPQ
ncbi:kxDL motif-containing protein 1 isoform X2 [Herrania umbratica]|uniref:KxDL motif-containing protein 1 isoform X2 n=1 Tax=Herrania umbratica TaxID=108875 RepID=A0A6J1BFP2_9ROSI|nr:kxDL motif-containing protein 1 isoform X2 [Herrania umbratica]